MTKKTFEPMEQEIGQSSDFILPGTGSLDGLDFAEEFEVVGQINLKEVELMLFMEEQVEIQLHRPSNPKDPLVLHTCVQGRNQFIVKGKAQWVKRKFVEALARGQRMLIETPEAVDKFGVKTHKIERSFILENPFSVLTDRNPMGRQWLEGILAEGV
jgi:hypothetical protein